MHISYVVTKDAHKHTKGALALRRAQYMDYVVRYERSKTRIVCESYIT